MNGFFRTSTLVLAAALVAGCGQTGGMPALSSGPLDGAAAQRQPHTYDYWEFKGSGHTSGSWHGHGKNDCHGEVKSWAATATAYVNSKTGAIYTKTPAILSVSLTLEGTCTNGESGTTYASEIFRLKTGKINPAAPPSPLSRVALFGNVEDPSAETGTGELHGPACNAAIETSKQHQGDANTYLDIDALVLLRVKSQIGC